MDILIAEDDRVSALKLSRALEKLGHVVIVAENGSEAWRHIQSGNVRLLITDWMMPGIDGPELCRRIRARTDGWYTYIVLLTARDGREARLEGLEAGADDFLTKPLDPAELVARLNVASRILSMQDQLQAQADQLLKLHVALERQNEYLASQATTDGLTGLKNRRFLDEAVNTATTQACQNGTPLSLILLDVDHFKSFNDTFGHLAGDDVLRQVAFSLSQLTRVTDVAARYGGEEFAVLLPKTGKDQALGLAERLRAGLAALDWPLRDITASFGVTTLFPPALTADRLVAEADLALYQSKAQGRNRVTHFSDVNDSADEARNEVGPVTLRLASAVGG